VSVSDACAITMEENVQPILTRVLETTLTKFIPFNVIFEITYRCNLRCQHCYIPEVNRHKDELTTEEIESVIDQLAELGCLYLTLTGGEVLLRPDFFRIARYAKRLGFALRIFTNGTLVTPQIADKIAEIMPMTVDISIYGNKGGTHDQVTRAKGTWERSMNAVRMLRERGVRTVMKLPLMTLNVGEYKEVQQVAEEIGAECRMDPTIAAMDDHNTDTLPLRIDAKALYEVFSDRQLFPQEQPAGAESPICEAGRNTIGISPTGEIYPCIQLQLSAGNIRDRSLKEIWENGPIMHQLRNLRVQDLKHCATCKLQKYCNRCPGLAHLEDGDWLGRSSRACQIAGIRRKIDLERKAEKLKAMAAH